MKRLIRTIFAAAMLLVSITGASKANPVDLQTARNVAYNFLRSLSEQPIGDLTNITASTPWHEFYTFNFEYDTTQQNAPKSGFIIVSADDCVIPILGYSLSNRLEMKDLPAHILSWMQSYEDQIAWLRKHEMEESLIQSSSSDSCTRVREAWERLLTGTSNPGWTNVVVGPLISTTWGQGQYYNNLCPSGSGGRTYTGCVATAAAQIMKYWNHPTTGRGSHSYTYRSYGTLSANFGSTTYNWSDMPDSLTSTSPSTAVNAIATLMYHVGVAVETSYGTNSSGAYTSNFGSISFPCVENALPTYFKYSSALHSVFIGDYTIDEWISLLQTEIDNNRPILYSGSGPSSGHAFVCDGYNGVTGHFHINWGWVGRCDDYFAIGALNPCPYITNANDHTYNLYNSAIIGIQPQTCWDTTTVITISSDSSGYGSVSDSGIYYYGDTVSVRANANCGKRFVRWSDGYRFNPRQFVVSCESNSFTAQFEALGGDTLSYCTSSTQLESAGSNSTGSDKYWGIRLPAATLTNGHDLREVQMYAIEAGTYTLNVYSGGTSSANMVYTSNFTVSSNDVDDWYVINLSTPVDVDGTQDIYITFYNNDVRYPAAMTYCSGNSDALLWGSSFNSISSSWDYSFMIRGIFGEYVCPLTSGDTISYCDDRNWQTTIGAGDSLYWGISFDTSCLVGHDSIEQVLLYVLYPGTYTMNIYSGNDTSPTTLLYTDTYIINDSLTYFSCILDSLLPIDHSQQLWVTFHNSGISYPAIACNYVGDPHSNWVSTNGTSWSPLHVIVPTLPYSWMIKVVSPDTIVRDTCNGVGSIPYTTGFEAAEHNECWNFVNGSCTNKWTIGSATNNTTGGSCALYISNNGGANNHYSISNAQSSVAAYRTIQFDTGRYSVSFDWKAYGEAGFDYLRVALVPAEYSLTSYISWDTSSLLPGFIPLDGNNQLNSHTAWITHTTEVSIPTSGLYNIVFYWHNDDNTGYNPPAAIDNIIIQELIECNTDSVDIYVSACDTYTWHDNTYTSSSIDSFTSINSHGCDSTITLHLTINHSTTATETVTACDSYTWHDSIYTISSIISNTGVNQYGCDSTVTLHLTINHSTTATETVTACDSYTWNGNIYTISSIDSISSINSQGCDSVTTLNLTINYSTSGNEVLSACDSLEWHGTVYTESTDTPTFVTTNAADCDSTVTLHLTINYSSRTTIVDTATNSYEWNGETYTESGEYIYEGQTEAGCDSIVVLQLTINQVGIAEVTDLNGITLYPNPTTGKLTIEASEEAKVEVFDQSGRIVDTFHNSNVIDIRHLPTGAYTLRITLHNGTAVKRAIKQ